MKYLDPGPRVKGHLLGPGGEGHSSFKADREVSGRTAGQKYQEQEWEVKGLDLRVDLRVLKVFRFLLRVKRFPLKVFRVLLMVLRFFVMYSGSS